MAVFRLQLLGAFQATVDGAPSIAFRSNKTRALLAYLALNGGRAHTREALATLLWGDYSPAAARTSLRQVIANLRQVATPLLDAHPPALTITRHTLQMDTDHPQVWVDVLALRHLLARVQSHEHPNLACCTQCRCWLEGAVSLYHGDFLAGLQVEEASLFQEWRLAQQEALHQEILEALLSLSTCYAAGGDLTLQANTLRRLLHLQPWHEEAHRQLMDLLARTGQRAAALAQYERCRQILAEELGVEPAPETAALYRLIQAEPIPEDALPGPATPRDRPSHNLPPPTTPFIGRDALLAQVVDALPRADVRLVTLLGPGGVGKTRLALEAAHRLLTAFPGGVWFVPLAQVARPGPEEDARRILAGAILEQLGLTPGQPEEPWRTLTAYLRPREALLILDNLEHLLPQAGELVGALLEAGPRLTLLGTSQVRLRLGAERVIPIPGLAWPPTGETSPEAAMENDGVALFVERAGRTLAGFQLDRENVTPVAHICRLVDGLPLAIELAAALTEHFTPEEIAATLGEDMTLLAEPPGTVDLPPRQQGVKATFDYAWRLLARPEQEMLAQLSLFRGEFSRDAGLAVSRGSLAALAGLVDRSLLRVVRPGRYALHLLVRHFAAMALDAYPDLWAAATARYVRFFAAFLQQQHPRLEGPRQPEALAAIHQEMDNVRQAWELAVAGAQLPLLTAMLPPLVAFFTDSGRLAAGAGLLTAAREELAPLARQDQAAALLVARLDLWRGFFMGEGGEMEAGAALLAGALPCLERLGQGEDVAQAQRILGSFETRLGQLARGIARLKQARQAFAALGHKAGLARTLSALGHAWETRGDYRQAQEALAQSLIMLRQLGGSQALAKGLNNYGLLCYRLGEYEKAEEVLREAVALNEAGDNRPSLGASLANLGLVLAAQRRYPDAEATFQRALAIQREEGNLIRVAILLNNLGDVANAQGRHEEALGHLQESLILKVEMGDERGRVFSLLHLGRTRWLLEQPEAALVAYREVLVLARRLAMVPLILAAFVGLAEMALVWDTTGLSQQMLALAASHPASWRRVRDEAEAVAAGRRISLDVPPSTSPDSSSDLDRRLEEVLDQVLQILPVSE